jgi:TPR repeat protein
MSARVPLRSALLFLSLVCLQPHAAAQRAPSSEPSGYTVAVDLCNKGDAKACNVVGAMYATGLAGVKADQAQALNYFQKSCNGGHGIGCANLANQYYSGLGVATDQAKAAQVYQRSCDLGAVTGCVDLGVIYRDGKGVPKNLPHAVQLLQRACDLSAAACASIASMYELGIGVGKDLAKAKTLYERSCRAPRSSSAEDIQSTWSNAACNVLSRMK